MEYRIIDLQSIGPALREIRTAKGMTLEQVGKGFGYSPSHLQGIEQGRLLPSPPGLLAVLRALGAELRIVVDD